jgi:hypothetical protein
MVDGPVVPHEHFLNMFMMVGMCRNQPLSGWLCMENLSWEAFNE